MTLRSRFLPATGGVFSFSSQGFTLKNQVARSIEPASVHHAASAHKQACARDSRVTHCPRNEGGASQPLPSTLTPRYLKPNKNVRGLLSLPSRTELTLLRSNEPSKVRLLFAPSRTSNPLPQITAQYNTIVGGTKESIGSAMGLSDTEQAGRGESVPRAPRRELRAGDRAEGGWGCRVQGGGGQGVCAGCVGSCGGEGALGVGRRERELILA